MRDIYFDRNCFIHILCCESCTEHQKREIRRLSKSGTFSRFFFFFLKKSVRMSRISTIEGSPFFCGLYGFHNTRCEWKIFCQSKCPLYRLHANFITYRFVKIPWQGEQGLKDRRDQGVSKSGTFSSFFFNK